MTPEKDPLLKDIQETLDRQNAEDNAAKRALATPLPGPLADAFAIVPDIKVGKYSIRPFYDMDYEVLQSWNHPVGRMMSDRMTGVENEFNYIPRGSTAWELAWLLTRSPEDAEEGIKNGVYKDQAAKEFGRLRIAGLSMIINAVMQQISVYWSTTLEYGDKPKEGESKNPLS